MRTTFSTQEVPWLDDDTRSCEPVPCWMLHPKTTQCNKCLAMLPVLKTGCTNLGNAGQLLRCWWTFLLQYIRHSRPLLIMFTVWVSLYSECKKLIHVMLRNLSLFTLCASKSQSKVVLCFLSCAESTLKITCVYVLSYMHVCVGHESRRKTPERKKEAWGMGANGRWQWGKGKYDDI